MKNRKYYTREELESMPEGELRELARIQQDRLEALRWSTEEIKESLIAALQALPRNIES